VASQFAAAAVEQRLAIAIANRIDRGRRQFDLQGIENMA
jgi:hypothetical protein